MFDKLISLFAPHLCLGCRVEGKLLCTSCASSLTRSTPRCFGCQALNEGGRTCIKCRRSSKLYSATAAFTYDKLAKDLVYKLKFGGSRSAASTMAGLMKNLDALQQDCLIVHLPTTTGRRRQRGFDQAKLLAAELGRRIEPVHYSVLERLGQSRQVGATREQRLNQLRSSFLVTKPSLVAGRRVVIVDDVMTTGASLSAAAATLKQAGAKRVEAVVFARA